MNITIGPAPLHYLHETDALVNDTVVIGVTNGILAADAGPVTLRLSAGGNPIATFTAAPYNGAFTFYDVEQKVRDYMLANDLTFSEFSLTFEQAGDSLYADGLRILFCENRHYDIEADLLAERQFLTAAPVTLLRQDFPAAPELSAFVPADDEAENGHLMTIVRDMYPNDGTPAYRREEIRGTGPASNGTQVITAIPSDYTARLKKSIVRIGDRTQTFFMLTAGTLLRLRFRNRFNVTETQDLPGTLTHTPSTEKEYAVFGEERQDYDIEHTDEYTFTTDPLPPQVFPALLDFARSRKPEVELGDTYREVVVTGYETERSDAPDSPIRFTVTFLLRDRRRRME